VRRMRIAAPRTVAVQRIGRSAAEAPIARAASAVGHDFARLPVLQRQAAETGNKPGCTPGKGVKPDHCDIYNDNLYWLPYAYAHNATCACEETPDTPSANAVRKFLQQRLAATPADVKSKAKTAKALLSAGVYEAWVVSNLTPRIYQDHVDAYAAGCCTSGPAPYEAWVAVTTIPTPCFAVGLSILQYGSCHGTPGKW
jgi:hypothetical protein